MSDQFPPHVQTFTDYWKAEDIPASTALYKLHTEGFVEKSDGLYHEDGRKLLWMKPDRPPAQERQSIEKPTIEKPKKKGG